MASVAEEVDRISHLPGDIIHHIFSFLPFKDVVKTSVLSKQWRFAWTSTPFIDLALPSKGVVPWISRALSLCTATKIGKFHLDATVSELYIPAELDLWFCFAVVRKVEDVSLVFERHWSHYVPRILCSCASLVSLQVSRCRFSRESTFHWPSLKKLCLGDDCLCDNGIMNVLSGCPVLESLTLCSIFINLQIESRCLRELVIEAAYITMLDISALNLVSLRLSGGFVVKSFRLNGIKNKDFLELCDFDEEQFWGSQKDFYCVGNHLKSVEIVGFELDNEKSKLLLALAKFLLEKAVGLEKMILDAEVRMPCQGLPIDPHDPWDFHDVIRLQEGCRRASKNVEVIVNHRSNGLPHEL
ncbi:hypothetical protein BT93_E2274 [Corymbia citriodora subsp. variegata]|nr:hypothetical protein BT93_E2274 [Corymbia citriodora subsp. variegata]